MNARTTAGLLFCLTLLFTAAARDARADGRAVYAKSIYGTVIVYDVESGSWGTGAFVDKEHRLVVTNSHVVGRKQRLTVIFPPKGTQGIYTDARLYQDSDKVLRWIEGLSKLRVATTGEVVANRPEKDLAVLKIATWPDYAEILPLAAVSPKRGAVVHIIGHPAGRDRWRYTLGQVENVCDGVVNTTNGNRVKARLLRFQGNVFGGNSGSPILNDRAKLVAIHFASSHPTGFAIHVDEVRTILGSLGVTPTAPAGSDAGRRRWEYVDDQGRPGWFVDTGNGQWREYKNGQFYATFREVRRSNSLVELFDSSRGLTLRICGTLVDWRTDGEWNRLPFEFTPANFQ